MENASVYVNGKLIGTHPYGYTSFRYDVTSAVTFGGENVVAIKTDTSRQPAERFYKGAGIYREVRLVTTNAVQIDQYGLYVSSSSVSTSSATVKVQVTVINKGSSSASVGITGTLTDPSGTALSPVSGTAQTVAAGARATITFNIAVSNPKLWDLSNPNLYNLAASVTVGGTVTDTSTTTVGIRSLTFSASTGMALNGKSVKFQGVCLHQDYHSLGMAAPKRAMQRRLSQLKTLGVNAIRTSHDPPSPAFLDLTDKMGFLVLDEFFDVWVGHKYSDVGDYATYFNTAASSTTGTPPVPDNSSPKWYEVDVTSVVSRDRNHPSIALYSTGNEIRDSISVRTPLLTRMKAIVNSLDPGRLVTQALFQPSTAGDIAGATRTIVDVFGANYRTAEVLQAMALSPARAGLITEIGTPVSGWTDVANNAALTGLFLWTGADHLGEANGLWPIVGASPGIIDAVGTVKAIGYSWQTTWNAPKTSPPTTGSTASKIVLTAERSSVTTDVNDIVYIKATIADTSNNVVSGSSASITFSVSGPGVIVAVDSGNQSNESFRGNVRKAYQGVAFVLVRATGAGTISVSATSSGLTGGSASVSGSTGVPVFP